MDIGESIQKILQHGLAALKKRMPKPILIQGNKTNKKLVFAQNLGYEACLGYQNSNVTVPKPRVQTETFVTSSEPKIAFAAAKVYPFVQQKLGDDACVQSNAMDFEELQPKSATVEEDNFTSMIDDMAYKVWSCGQCLSMGHPTTDCTNEIRCQSCFSYGHVRKKCLAAKSRCKAWVPKKTQSGTSSGTCTDKDKVVSGVAVSASTSFNAHLGSLQQSIEHINPVSPPVSTCPSSSPAMAVLEVDPTPWLPWGHELIDGGPTRLPRTYYYASQDPPPRHLDHCIALVDPPPPPAGLALWREQVRDFLIGPLQRNVVRSQPSLFGVGLYQMSSPNSVNTLV
jgi:hypothetical protein